VISMTVTPLKLFVILTPTAGHTLTNINGTRRISSAGEDAHSEKCDGRQRHCS
jgi:hypothetical protein